MKADEFLGKAQALMIERGKQYDQPNGERSMAKAVAAFGIITGVQITEAEGWLFMQILKDVRQWQTDAYHADSAEDCVAYAALKAEALAATAPECDFVGAPDHATHKIRYLGGIDMYGWAFLDGDRMRECDTQYLIDMEHYEIVATRKK